MSYGVQDRGQGPLTRDFAATLSIGRYLQEPAAQKLVEAFHPEVVIEEWVERQILASH